ncbi:MAG: hypothetical protein NZL93_02240, partial [Chthoniobacterales bacterium]|nr:hypothetical protein [Chthoniobacterales bacterium]
IRPFIAAYWGWSGYLQTLRDERYYDIVVSIAQTTLSSSPLCLIILLSHIFLGYLFAWIGLRRFANVL